MLNIIIAIAALYGAGKSSEAAEAAKQLEQRISESALKGASACVSVTTEHEQNRCAITCNVGMAAHCNRGYWKDFSHTEYVQPKCWCGDK